MKKKFFYYPLMACAVMTCAACQQKGGVMGAGIDKNNMDLSAKPGTDFYTYACGGWIKNNPLTPEYSRFGTFDKLGEENRKQIQDIIEEMAKLDNKPGSIEQKIGDLYNMSMDSVKRNADGIAPIKKDMERIATIKGKEELPAALAQFNREGLSLFFGVYVGADQKDSKSNLVAVYQSGISLGEKEYYLDEDEHTKEIRDKYKLYATNMFKLAGYDEATAAKKMQAMLDIETQLAKSSRNATERRDPYANYNKMTFESLKKDFKGFDWDVYFSTIGLPAPKELDLGQPEFIREAINVINTKNLDDIKTYMEWKLLEASASYLDDATYNESFNFYGKVLSGKKEQSPRWKRSVSLVNGALGEAVGQIYVKKYFPPQAKERMIKLVKNLQIALGERIDMQDWMSDETKKKAHEKLDAFYVKIGYPDTWRDYSDLDINKDEPLWENVKRSNQFDTDYNYAKYGKPVDRTEWLMNPQTVNAYYNPTTNEICFPAAILQYPFFDMQADDAFNYGAIGVVIGHEMTHGFDDQGSQYDKDGNLNNWWTEEDAKKFKERTQVMKDFFNNIEVLPGLHANGELTLGENIADHGGLKIAFQAYKNATKDAPLQDLDGFTPDQRFYIAYATLWAGNIRDEQIRVFTKSDPHSLGKWRVNGALPQIDTWYEAFNITESDPLFVPKEKRVNVW